MYQSDGNYRVPELRPIPNTAGTLELLHPGYPRKRGRNANRRILSLGRFDPDPGSGTVRYGVHCGTLMMMCFIITGNRLGFLSPTELAGSGPVPTTPPPDTVREFDTILPGPAYYYYICMFHLVHLSNLLQIMY
jgi:hypothetical protein